MSDPHETLPTPIGSASNSDPTLVQPTHIGRYRVDGLLGEGGFGRVYLAHDPQLGRAVAIKVPRAERVAGPEDAAAYLAEARIVARLDHPHIVPVHDVGTTDDGLFYVVSKLIEGSDLANRTRQAPLSHVDAAGLVATVAEALHYAHRQGLVHRDVKPANILLDAAGRPYVADFGLALKEAEVGKGATFAGTPAYMSPEQARGEGHRVDGRSDLFSLGVVFYELLVGRRPFTGDSQQELLEHITTIDARPPRQWDDAVPKELERICLKALSKRAADRYTTAKDFADDLRHWLDGDEAASRSDGPAASVTPSGEAGLRTALDQLKVAFLSYAQPDQAETFRLCRHLEERGISCWIAPRDVPAGGNYAEAIIRAIEGTSTTVLLLSEHANASIHVQHEVERATSKRKRVIPVRLAVVQPGPSLELHLATVQWIDAWKSSPEQVADQLAAVLRDGRPAAPTPTPVLTTGSDSRPLKIVPKGLRSFDAHDADFFLELLPGPRDRDGLPDSIRFWKTRIEERDPDQTFAVGLIYGPSGCGKSSLVKAGLLPRLSGDVIPVYLEATADDTETRLLNGLRKRCPELPAKLSLTEALATLRRGPEDRLKPGLPPRKIVIVLDQFEQWLHAKKEETNTELVQALRQCDGGRVQCIVMVRDDFWMAATRFMRDLEVRLVEAQNSAAVDLFDMDHARKVLSAFGRAFGKLPETPGAKSKDQEEFLKQAVAGLAQEGKVISVRLALFAEMMKGKPWTPASLKEVGGTEGVGVTFLDETFSHSTAPPEHRYHQKAAQAVLRSLLPEAGTDIKGHMRSQKELLAASGYAQRPRDFDDLLRILDSEVRLITPTDPEGKDNVEASAVDAGERYYQLTHDYLVPALRDWLTRKQKETRRGRAEILLAERSATWNAKPLNRHLPAWHEDLRIRALTKRSAHTTPQRRMLRASGRFHLMRWGLAAALLLALGLSVERFVAQQRLVSDQKRAASLVDSVLTAPPDAVPFAIANLQPLRELAVPLLRQRQADETQPAAQRLHAALGLAEFGTVEPEFLVASISTAADGECRNLVTALSLSRASAVSELQTRFTATDSKAASPTRARLAIVALHLGEPQPAIELCQLAADPTPRRIFEETLAVWNAGVAELGTQVDAADNGSLRAACSLGVGRIPPERLPEAERQAGAKLLTGWFQQAADTGTHSATDWALRQWQLSLPPLKEAAQPSKKRDWYVTSQGTTMLQIPAGRFRMGSEKLGVTPVEVTLTRAFFLGDREVSVGQFQAFVDDPETPGSEKAVEWPGVSESFSPTAAHPVQLVNWNDAVLYCNWLSRREGRQPCYERTGAKEKGSGDQEYDAWRRIPDADGYRLPTEAEWEYACRAGTTTDFSFGDDEELLRRYAVFSASLTEPCGSRLPNGYGLFDMLGNVQEWCQDSYGQLPGGRDPEASQQTSYRVDRGGSWYFVGRNCRSAYRDWFEPEFRDDYLGFRVATVRSSQ